MDGRIAHILSCASSLTLPLRVCYPNIGKYHVNACKYVCKHTKKHHGHGIGSFACVVGANWNSPTPQFAHIAKFTHVANSFTLQFTHVDGRIAIRPYTCVIRTLANIHINHVNTQKKTSWAWYEGICVCRRGELQFAHTTICPYCKIHPRCKIHPHYNSSTPQFAYIAPLKLQGQGGAKGVMCRFPDGEHREGGRGLWYGLFYGEGLFSFS